MGLVLIVALLLGTLARAGSSIQAQAQARDIPLPAECAVTPRDLPLPLATPLAVHAPSTPSPAEGQPASDQEIAAISATVREAIACTNAGEILRAFALFTDDYLRGQFTGPDAWTEDDFDLFVATPATAVPPIERLGIVAIDQVLIYPDGRATAVVVTATSFERFEDEVTFVLSGDRWLIDASRPLETISLATPAT